MVAIIVALISGVIGGIFGLVNVIINANVNIKTTQIKQNNEMLVYRINNLEKKIDKQDTIEKEMILLKEQFKTALEDIKDIQDQLKF